MTDWASVTTDHLAAVRHVARQLTGPEHLVLALDATHERGALTLQRLGMPVDTDLVILGLPLAHLYPLVAGGAEGEIGAMIRQGAATVVRPDQALLAVGAEYLWCAAIDVPPADDWEWN